MELKLVTKEKFNNAECDFYQNETGDIFMTIEQLAEALGYNSRKGIEMIFDRNKYLKALEFTTTHKLWVELSDGRKQQREMTLLTEDGIYEITLLSKKPKAREFREFVRKILKSLRKKEIEIPSVYPSLEEEINKHFKIMTSRIVHLEIAVSQLVKSEISLEREIRDKIGLDKNYRKEILHKIVDSLL